MGTKQKVVTDDETEVDDADVDDLVEDDDEPIPSRIARIEKGLADIGEFIRTGVGNVGGDAAGDVEDDPEDLDDGVTEPAATTAKSQRQTEMDVEATVRAQLAKIKKEEETDARLAKVEEKVAEKPPAKQSRLQRALWGSVNPT